MIAKGDKVYHLSAPDTPATVLWVFDDGTVNIKFDGHQFGQIALATDLTQIPHISKDLKVGVVVTFAHDYDLQVQQMHSIQVYHFKTGDTAKFVRHEEKGAVLRFPHGEFRVPYRVLNIKKPVPPPPPPKTRFDIIEES